MFDYKKLRGKIREVFGTEKQFAKALGISSTSLSLKFSGESSFKQSQISRCCELLGIPVKEIGQYFFAPLVEKTQHKGGQYDERTTSI